MNSNEKILNIKNKGWANITKEDLKYLYFDLELIKSQIASLFNIDKSKVSYKLKKFGLNGQSKMIKDSLSEIIRDVKMSTIQKFIFSEDKINYNNSENELYWGPVKVIKGKYAGRIGCYDDDEGKYGLVFWGNMVSTLDSCNMIRLSYLSNDITMYDLVTRATILENKIGRMRAQQTKEDYEIQKYEEITELYGEYVYIMQLMNIIYEETFHQKGNGDKNIFISYSSCDKQTALWIATDLKKSKYNVWFDMWDIIGGHSIPDKIGEGIENADAMIMLISKTYNSSIFCRDEWQSFYMKYSKVKPNSIIPIIIDDSEPPTLLSNRRYIRMNSTNNYNEMLTELKTALKLL